jgi:hypothetical protein
MFVYTEGKEARLGPVVEALDVAKGDKITLHFKRQRVVIRTSTISDAVRALSAARILDSISSKVASELAGKAPGFSGKVQTELSEHREQEITTEVEKTLTQTASYSIEDTEGREYEIELDGEAGARTAQLRRRYWPRLCEVHLHSYDYLELEYRDPLLWRKVRETIKRVDSQRLGQPLVSVTFYEPQPDLVVSYAAVSDELENTESFETLTLTKPMPNVSGPKLQDLEVAARLAFPITRKEKAAAKDRKQRVQAAAPVFALAKGGRGKRKKAAAKKTARKSAKRRSPPKKTGSKRRTMPKKAARRR